MSMDDNEMDLAEAVAAVGSLFPAGPIGDDVASDRRGDGWTVPVDAMAFAACVGEAIWSVFSNNHDVISPEGRVVSLGTWRGSGDEIAEFLNRTVPAARFDYMDFYSCEATAPLAPVVRLVLRRLHDRGFDWRHADPRHLGDTAQYQHEPGPVAVQAYRTVFGRDPIGWQPQRPIR